MMLCSFSYGQMSKYQYARSIKGITSQWNKIVLPTDIYGKLAPEFSDLRIFGVTQNKDTIEAPYLLSINQGSTANQDVSFKILNKSRNESGYFFTFEVPTNSAINEIKLDFVQQNFDWKVRLEGSQDQQEWYNILKDYRILSIKNELTNYQFTKLKFPSSKYRFYRIKVDTKEQVELLGAKISKKKTDPATYRAYEPRKSSSTELNKHTEIGVDLASQVPISFQRKIWLWVIMGVMILLLGWFTLGMMRK